MIYNLDAVGQEEKLGIPNKEQKRAKTHSHKKYDFEGRGRHLVLLKMQGQGEDNRSEERIVREYRVNLKTVSNVMLKICLLSVLFFGFFFGGAED